MIYKVRTIVIVGREGSDVGFVGFGFTSFDSSSASFDCSFVSLDSSFVSLDIPFIPRDSFQGKACAAHVISGAISVITYTE